MVGCQRETLKECVGEIGPHREDSSHVRDSSTTVCGESDDTIGVIIGTVLCMTFLVCGCTIVMADFILDRLVIVQEEVKTEQDRYSPLEMEV